MFRPHILNRSGAAGPLLIRNLSLCISSILFAVTLLFDSSEAGRALAGRKSEPQSHTVLIKDFKYVPETLTVKTGDTVIWKNEDIVPHTATTRGKGFDSKNIAAGASWKYVVNRTGDYSYICTYHPTMKARLIVK